MGSLQDNYPCWCWNPPVTTPADFWDYFLVCLLADLLLFLVLHFR